MNSIDFFIQNYFSGGRTEDLTELMYIVSRIFNFSVMFVLLIILIGIFIGTFPGKKYHSILFLTSILFTPLFVFALKYFFNVSRPTNGVLDAFGKSFPSYHATISAVLFIMLIYIFQGYFKSFGKIIFNSLCILSIFLVAFSRIYLGVHWFSDVFFGVILGILISYLFIRIFKHVMNIPTPTSMIK